MTNNGADTEAESTAPRRFAQLPDLAVPADFDKPLPPTEAALWEAPDPDCQDSTGAHDELDDDWPIDGKDLRGEEEIRARHGLPPRSDTGGQPSS